MSRDTKLPTLASLIKSHDLFGKKSLGQHFLTDPNLLDKIAMSAGNISGRTVVEIGPGPGGLTRALLNMNPERLIVIEKDRRCIEILKKLSAHYEGVMEIWEKDALEIKIKDISGGNKVKIIANLPYNISTELLTHWLDELEHIESMTLMFQKEVAERITSQPGGKQYGRLAVLCQWLCEANILFNISAKAFTPPPKVESSVVSIIPRKEPLFPANKESLYKICKATFGQRRKMLRVSLKQLTENPEELLKKAGINPQSRPEELSIENFCSLARAYQDFLSA